MSDEKLKQMGERIQNEIAETISASLNMPVFSISQEAIQKLVDEVKKLPKIEDKYSPSELHEEVASFLSQGIVFRPKTESEARERIEKFLTTLKKEKTYEATIILPSVIGLPIGTKIGSLEIVEPNIDDKHLIEYLEFQKEHNQVFVEGRSQAKVVFKAYTSTKATNVLYKLLELPFAIISLLLDFDLNPRDCAGNLKSPDITTTYFLEPQRKIFGWSRYHSKYLDEHLERLSKISIAKNPSRLQKKILQALQVYGLSRFSQKGEIRFLFLISAFESLLLTENDKDYLGKKISEKTAFLLENEYEKRLQLYKQMKSFYGKRSGLVHSGKTEISDSEVRTLDDIFRVTSFKLLELSMSYSKMEQRTKDNEPEGVEDLINKLKFS